MIENEALTEGRKGVANSWGIPSHLLADVSRAVTIAVKAFSPLVETIKKYVDVTLKAIKMAFVSTFGFPIKVGNEMHKLGIDLNYLRVSLQYSLFEIPPRIMHLATRHKSPIVRKKNQKRIRKILYGY